MHDLSQTETGLEFDTDVCVIGAGVAGQSVARRLASKGCGVVLAESGGKDFDRATQDLAKGDNVGFTYYDLVDSRLRLYGGTTAIWGGRCVALDPIDFKKRSWVPHSGWPISYDTLDPYVNEAFGALGLRRINGYEDIDRPRPGFDPEQIDCPLWSFDEKGERFTGVDDLPHGQIQLVLNANMTSMDLSDGSAVREATFKSLNGREMQVRARYFILAAGGIETARLLLAGSKDRPNGIGNERDQVGRYFMEHPHGRGGAVIPAKLSTSGFAKILALSPVSIRHKGARFAPAFRVSEQKQEELGLLNSALSLSIRRHEGLSQDISSRMVNGLKHGLPSTKRLRGIYRNGKYYARKLLDQSWSAHVLSKILTYKQQTHGIYAVLRAEQAPNPDSRVHLIGEKDALGMPRSALDWRFTTLDRSSVQGLMQVFGDEVARIGLGHVEPASWLSDADQDWKIDPLVSSHPIGGYHHMGGTRMASSPSEGVCDESCKVFDCDNLYVAGSSLFPTSGWANPTITIIALANRLGDHLAAKLGQAEG